MTDPPQLAGQVRLRVRPVFGGDLDTRRWAGLHRAGTVPDAVPYGLDRMAAHRVDLLEPGGGWHTTATGRRARGLVRRAGRGFDWALALAPAPPADGVLCWDERAGVPLSLAHGRRTPVVTNVIWLTDAPPRRRDLRVLVRQALGRAARVTVLSSGQVPVLVEELGVARSDVVVVPFGVDTDFFALRAGEGDPDHVVCVGNDRDRDWPTALAAFARVRARRPGARMTLVSRTVGQQAVGRDGVHVVPHLDHVALRELLGTATAAMVLTRPNLHASGITAVLEAQAVGVPVVATRTPGMQDYAPADGGVVLAPPGDVGAAGDLLLPLLEDPSLAAGRGEAGRGSVTARFSTAIQAEHLARVVREAVDAHGR